MTPMSNHSFRILGPDRPQRPVILSVPHAGRDYSDQLTAVLRSAPSRLTSLEDRYADALIDLAVVASAGSAIVSTAPRVWIDLNRDEMDLDPALFSGPVRHNPMPSAKTRGGLGLIPAHTAQLGALWRRTFSPQELEQRLSHHRAYHHWIDAALTVAADDFGEAVLLDVHSMPSLKSRMRHDAPDIVIGDLYRRSSHSRFSDIAAGIAERHGLRVALNSPYPGNYMLSRHGAPREGRHALQLEIDRSLYLNSLGTEVGAGIGAIQRLLSDLVTALNAEIGFGLAVAAE